MKRRLLSFFVFFLFTGVLYAQDSISISDFRYPETRAIDWKIGLNGEYSSDQKTNEQTNDFLLYNYSSTFINVNSSLLYFHTEEMQEHRLNLKLSGQYSGSRSAEENREYDPYRTKSMVQDRFDGEIDFDGSIFHYVSEDGLHGICSILFLYSGGSGNYKNEIDVSGNYSTTEYDYYRYSGEFHGKLGIGYGKMRDGSVVFHAMRILDRLKEEGLLIKPVPNELAYAVINKLAEKHEYMTNYERYEKYFISDIIELLVAEGVIEKEYANPFSLFKVQEAFRENVLTRFFGWRVYYLFNDKHTQSLFDSPVRHDFENYWQYIHEFGFEYGLPISLRTHLYSNIKAELPNQEVQKSFALKGNLSLIYELGEHIELSLSYAFWKNEVYQSELLSVSYSKAIARQTQHQIVGNFVYFMEDRFSFRISLTANRIHQVKYPNSWQNGDFEKTRISDTFLFRFGLNYNLY